MTISQNLKNEHRLKVFETLVYKYYIYIFRQCPTTMLRENMNLPCSIRMYFTNFWQPTVHVQQNIFEKTLIKACSPHLYASFCTFCLQICQSYAAQWVFKQSEEFRNRRHFPSIRAIFTSKTHCASNNRLIWTQKVQKEA